MALRELKVCLLGVSSYEFLLDNLLNNLSYVITTVYLQGEPSLSLFTYVLVTLKYIIIFKTILVVLKY